MMKPLRWRLLAIAVITLWALYSVAPSIIYFASEKEVRNSPEEMAKRIPDWLPQKHVSLGLDLQGGVQLVLGVNTDNAVDNKLGRLATEIQRWSDDSSIGVAKSYVITGKQRLRLDIAEGKDSQEIAQKVRSEYSGLTVVNRTDKQIDFAFEESQIKHIKASAIEQAEKVVRNRVDKWGVSEPVINRRQVDNSILVQLPGFKDPNKAKELLGRTAQLRFKLVDDNFQGFNQLKDLPPEVTSNGPGQGLTSENRDVLIKYAQTKVPEDRQVFLQKEELAGGKKNRYTTFVVEASTEIGGDDILDAFVSEDTSGLDRRPEVSMKFTGPGGKRFADLTGANVGRRLAIVLDDEIVSAPVIQSKIANGQGRITLGGGGGYEKTFQEAQQLSLILKSGALPATIEVLEQRQVGATLGPELADQGIKSMLVGLALVLVYMIIYYRRPGMLANVALVLNALFLLALMAGLGFSLSLPGIAGFVLTLGMAVDANVLINERIREELSGGKNSLKAVDNGFSKVFWTIFDANVTSLIAAMVLLETNPAGPIRGFAVTLMIGLVVSMFTSMFCTRAFFDYFISKARTDKAVRAWLGGEQAEKARKFDFSFLNFSKVHLAIVGLLSLGLIAMGVVRGYNWGVDFAGGTEVQIRFAQDVEPDAIRTVGVPIGISSVTLQTVGEGRKQYLIRFGAEDIQVAEGGALTAEKQNALLQDYRQALLTSFKDKNPEVLSVDYVGPQIGRELRTQGGLSLLYAIIGILAYIAFRFDLRFGPGAVLKMVFDLLMTIGFYVYFDRSIDLTAIAAFLTVIGYSVNDVIVIYDRIRENITQFPRRNMVENINNALNETLTRSINTSVLTIVSLVGMLIFSSGSIWNFAMAMTVGVIAATASSTFLASASVIWFEGFSKWYRGRFPKSAPPNAAPTRT
jgi:protein-export membrane protein SecD/preprotein translocase SecF subunit